MLPVSSNPTSTPTCAFEPRRKRVVERGERNQHAHGDHRAGHGIADAGGSRGGRHQRCAREPRCVRHQQREHHGDHRRDARERKAVERQLDETRTELAVAACERHAQQHRGRDDESQQHRQAAGAAREPARRGPRRRHACDATTVAGVVQSRASRAARVRPARIASTNSQHEQRQLRGRVNVAERKPRAVDAGRECRHAEVRDGAEIGERLHHRQRDSGHDRRARERQRDANKRAPGAWRPAAGSLPASPPFARGTPRARRRYT